MSAIFGPTLFRCCILGLATKQKIAPRQTFAILKRSISVETNRYQTENNKENEFFTQYVVRNPSNTADSNFKIVKKLYLVMMAREDRTNLLNSNKNDILNLLKKGSLVDIALVTLAYFKTKTPIADTDLMDVILKRFIELLPTVNPTEPVYCSIVKAIRYSRRSFCRRYVSELATALKSINRDIIFKSTYNLVQTLKLFEAYRIYNREMFDLMIEAVLRDTDNFRIKDLQYILSSLSNLSHCKALENGRLKELLDKIVSLIVSRDRYDSEFHCYHLMPILRALAIFNYYDKRLIEFANEAIKDRKNYQTMKNVLEFRKTCLLMFSATRIEFPEYLFGSTHLYDADTKQVHEQLRLENRPSISTTKNKEVISTNTTMFVHELFEELSTGIPKELGYQVRLQLTFPHQNYFDIVVSNNSRWRGDFSKDNLEAKQVPAGEKHCLIYILRPFDRIDGSGSLSGYKGLMIRLLEKLGYRVLLVNYPSPVNHHSLLSRIELMFEKGDASSSNSSRCLP